ncbi:hypothetical protein EYF80_039857 [Liparis tanakae]|uniref:Uncharacterized protein n=1 Tax=Liparis tanakae TaxID=230148 RepID=A0A4Z2G9M5_9TELE|nr:hypothetical protein EYF80_039857 [Liparis tanakae]
MHHITINPLPSVRYEDPGAVEGLAGALDTRLQATGGSLISFWKIGRWRRTPEGKLIEVRRPPRPERRRRNLPGNRKNRTNFSHFEFEDKQEKLLGVNVNMHFLYSYRKKMPTITDTCCVKSGFL